MLENRDCMEVLAAIPNGSIDLTLTSPPYCIGKDYENERSSEDFLKNHKRVLPEIIRVTRAGGAICWQVGYHVTDGVVIPLDYLIFQVLSSYPEVILRNRIVWSFGHGLHSNTRFSGRHETLLWFTKGKDYTFNLDTVRIPQLYPGKKAYKGDLKGEPSGNPLGKNPTDVWEIPNVKANHIEKTGHPCQFPLELARRAINAFTSEGDVVLDPYLGSGTTAAAAVQLKRKFIGCDTNKEFFRIAKERVKLAEKGKLPSRPDFKPVYKPKPNTPLTTIPEEWRK